MLQGKCPAVHFAQGDVPMLLARVCGNCPEGAQLPNRQAGMHSWLRHVS